jgi:DNA-binding Lrp family transcriptional regulator
MFSTNIAIFGERILDETDHKILAFMEKGITLAPKPFNEIARQLGIPTQEVVARLGKLKEKGVIRRFGASIKPNNVGFFANALVAWRVPESRVLEIGEYLSKYQEISHCYERAPIKGRWNYNVYTVIHGRERAVVQRMVKEISDELAISEYKVLYSTRDLKRTNIDADSSTVASAEASAVLHEKLGEPNDP